MVEDVVEYAKNVRADKALAEKYAANWKAHAEHSGPYVGRGMEEQPAKQARKRKAR